MALQSSRAPSTICALCVLAASMLAQPPQASAGPDSEPACQAKVAHYQNGQLLAWMCEEQAKEASLTLVDLGDRWLPQGLRPAAGFPDADFNERYLRLANRDATDKSDVSASELSLYGIFPTLRSLFQRLGDTERYACHRRLTDHPWPAELPAEIRQEDPVAARKRIAADQKLRAQLEWQMRAQGLRSLDELAASKPLAARQLQRLRTHEARTNVIRDLQAHLICEGDLLDTEVDGILGWRSSNALRVYQRRNFASPSARIDEATHEIASSDPEQSDWRIGLRVLRERVADATGLIEDGSARNEAVPIVGQRLDPEQLVWPRGYAPAEEGQPDRIGRASDVAARQLGWQDPEGLRRFLARHIDEEGGLAIRVALSLPETPDYYSEHMDLRVVIDRGERQSGATRHARRPALLLYVADGDVDRLLVRWPTTVGGWQDELLASGKVVRRYKESPAGEFVWKTIYMAPRWLPPPSTPDEDLFKGTSRGKARLDRELFGPSFRSAYGLAMLVHHREQERGDDLRYLDLGIRSHGTGNILSLPQGYSHGCHRLLGFQVMRLTSFLLQHRQVVRYGPEYVSYQRVFRWRGQSASVHLDQRGYRFELTPPVPVRVLH